MKIDMKIVDAVVLDTVTLKMLLNFRERIVEQLETTNSNLSRFMDSMGAGYILMETPKSEFPVKVEGFLYDDWDINIKLKHLTDNIAIKVDMLKGIL